MSAVTNLNDLRRRVLVGESVSDDEYRSVLDALRVSRKAVETGPKRKTKVASGPLPDLDDLMNENHGANDDSKSDDL